MSACAFVGATDLPNAFVEFFTYFVLIEIDVLGYDVMAKVKVRVSRQNAHAVSKDVWLWRHKHRDHCCWIVAVHYEMSVTGNSFACKVIANIAARNVRKNRR